MTIQRIQVGKRLSGAVVHNGVVYVAGQVPDDSAGPDIGAQTASVLAKIDQLLKEAGSDRSRILSAQIFLPDMADFGAMNAAWEKWIPQGQTPARATIEAGLANAAYKVEIMCIAAV
jgi:enamine deaminase RidA (YjgF/YER057c/UK114 family)